MYSIIGLKLLAAQDIGLIKTNNDFWKNFSNQSIFNEIFDANEKAIKRLEQLQQELDTAEDKIGIVCYFDEEFPVINQMVKNDSEKPYLLFYQGNLSLLSNLNDNVAVIGLLDPDEEIITRETEIVKQLVKNKQTIVSGLAKGCDTVAHEVCLDMNGKTIAILPSTLTKISPATNRKLAKKIVQQNGLLVTEYYKEVASRTEAMKRPVERDRLQTMFSKTVIVIASYRHNEGDSGSRHAMEKAEQYGIERYVMYNKETDNLNPKFGLNKDYVNGLSADKKPIKPVNIIGLKSISTVSYLANYNLTFKKEQESLF